MKLSFPLFLAAVAGAATILADPRLKDAIGDAATEVMRPIVGPMVALLDKPSFVYVVSLLLLAIAVAASLRYRIAVVGPELRRLRRARAELDALRPPNADDRVRLADGIGEIGTILRARALFPIGWAVFQRRVLREGSIPAEPFATFAEADRENEDRDRAGHIEALPGYLTSAGLIFTFVGLVAALFFAAKGFKAGSPDVARAAVQQLLGAASFKFLTSVAALVGALLVTLTLRGAALRLHRLRAETLAAVERRLDGWRTIEDPRPAAPAVPAEALHVLATGLARLTGRIDRLLARVEPPSRAHHGA